MTLDEALLDDRLGELEKLRAWSPRVISKLESFLRTTDEWALFRANPFVFAEERGVNEEEAVDLFLLASRVGLFGLTWSLLCPGCGAAVQSLATLRNVCSVFHCYLCSVDVETRLDEFVQVGFTVSPKIRTIPAHDPSSLAVLDLCLRYHFTREARVAPGGPRFIEILPSLTTALLSVEPRTTARIPMKLEAGGVAVYNLLTSKLFPFMVEQGSPSGNPHFKVSSEATVTPLPSFAPGEIELLLENDSDRREPFMVLAKPQALLDEQQQKLARGEAVGMTFDRFLTGRRLLTSHTFRQIFGNEIIRSSDGIGVRDISILFTDLKGSTAMYDRIGDLKAFALVNQHFDRLGRAVTRHRGAVVKTIGDAVMASFETPSDAVLAARDMLVEIEAFNHEVGEREIVLKVGVHRGASIAVTLNDRLDFFGQTVNIAARVQGLADADEIYITDEVFRAPGVEELLKEFHVSPKSVSLRGVQRTVGVYRIGVEPPSASSATASA